MSVELTQDGSMNLDGPDMPPRRTDRIGIKAAAAHPLGMSSLEAFEASGAGHCLARHVHDRAGAFASDAARLAKDRGIPASGGFHDRSTAQLAVDAAVAANQARIVAWRADADRYHPFIAELGLDREIGRSLTREEFDAGVRDSLPTTGVRLVLMPDPRFGGGFAVLTAYNVRVPAPSDRPLAIRPLAEYGALGYNGVLRRQSTIVAAQIAAGLPAAARFSSTTAAQRVLAQGVAYWSSEIAAWLADPGTAPTLVRSFCALGPIGATLTPAEAAAGESRLTSTPVVLFKLTKDSLFAEGFAVADAYPSRSF